MHLAALSDNMLAWSTEFTPACKYLQNVCSRGYYKNTWFKFTSQVSCCSLKDVVHARNAQTCVRLIQHSAVFTAKKNISVVWGESMMVCIWDKKQIIWIPLPQLRALCWDKQINRGNRLKEWKAQLGTSTPWCWHQQTGQSGAWNCFQSLCSICIALLYRTSGTTTSPEHCSQCPFQLTVKCCCAKTTRKMPFTVKPKLKERTARW